MLIIGIDPGASGGIAFLEASGLLEVRKMPETEHDVANLLSNTARPRFAFIEAVQAMRKEGRVQGVSSTFKFGRSYGFLRGVITALQIPFEDVQPIKWQNALSCRTGGNKNLSKSAAQRLWPDMRFTHATADASLIAEYGRRHLAATGRL